MRPKTWTDIQLDMSRPTVVTQQSTLRDLFPFYSLDMFLSGAALVGAVYGLMLLLDPPGAMLVTVGGYVGMALVNWTARPSYFLITRDQEPALIAALRNINYQCVPSKDRWVPPLPRWLRWKYNFLRSEADGDAVRVVGPANLLAYLADQLS